MISTKIVITALVASIAIVSCAITAKAQGVSAIPEHTLIAQSTSREAYTTVLKACGSKWRASDERKTSAKGEAMQAWQTYRRACVLESGYKSKKGS